MSRSYSKISSMHRCGRVRFLFSRIFLRFSARFFPTKPAAPVISMFIASPSRQGYIKRVGSIFLFILLTAEEKVKQRLCTFAQKRTPHLPSVHFRHFDGSNNVSSAFSPLRFDGISENPNFFDRILFDSVYIILNYFVFSRLLKPQIVHSMHFLIHGLHGCCRRRTVKKRLHCSSCTHFAQSFAQLGCQELFRIACISCLHNLISPLRANCAV